MYRRNISPATPRRLVLPEPVSTLKANFRVIK